MGRDGGLGVWASKKRAGSRTDRLLDRVPRHLPHAGRRAHGESSQGHHDEELEALVVQAQLKLVRRCQAYHPQGSQGVKGVTRT